MQRQGRKVRPYFLFFLLLCCALTNHCLSFHFVSWCLPLNPPRSARSGRFLGSNSGSSSFISAGAIGFLCFPPPVDSSRKGRLTRQANEVSPNLPYSSGGIFNLASWRHCSAARMKRTRTHDRWQGYPRAVQALSKFNQAWRWRVGGGPGQKLSDTQFRPDGLRQCNDLKITSTVTASHNPGEDLYALLHDSRLCVLRGRQCTAAH